MRNDLTSKPLTVDDFTIIVGNKIINTFYPKDQLITLFPDAVKKESDTWQWSVLDDSGPMSLENVEFITKTIRFVYIEGVVNEYAGLFASSLTIRGIGIGDSAQAVLGKYGSSYYRNEEKDGFLNGDSGLIYRLYSYPKTANQKYPQFDYIYFETRAGKVIGIHYWRERSDAP
ncbi:MAG: hypothetical protein WCT14_12450 [Treponemataceae bacterium]